MSARLVISYWLLVISLFLCVSSVVAVGVGPGDQCPYAEEKDDGIYICQGIYELNNPDDPDSGLACKFDQTEGISPDCEKQPDNENPANPTDPTDPNEGTKPKLGNWGPLQQNAFQQGNGLDGFGCVATGRLLSKQDTDTQPDSVPDEEQTCPGRNPITGELTLYDRLPGGGALGGLGTVMLALYTNPSLSSNEYLASIGENLGVKEVYAQNIGSGASSGDAVIKPVLKLWQISRNISYMAFILVFVAIGFMIMLRAKISPQAVVTAQAALPGLVIGLILVTFSYFISALIIDLSFIGMNLVVFLFDSSKIINVIQDPTKVGAEISVLALFKDFVLNANHINQLVQPVQQAFQTAIPIFRADNPFGLILGGAVGGAVGILVMFIVLLAVLVQMFRLLWELISSYIAIFVTTIFAPFIILSSSLPGRGGKMDMWWKSLLGNALVFPAVFAAFLFAGVFLGSTDNKDFTQTLPLFAGLPVEILRVIIAYGIVLGTPAIPGMVKKAIGVPDIGGLSKEALQGFDRGRGVVAPVGRATGRTAAAAGVKGFQELQGTNRYQRLMGTPGGPSGILTPAATDSTAMKAGKFFSRRVIESVPYNLEKWSGEKRKP